ncbi:MAG: menaquinone biosynthesis decarboxylase [Bacteroidetes bacterium]|nr:menaquinone biosynthesis decarboxylase [Bacteroidota bacterium]
MYKTLREYISKLDANGELLRVTEQVNTHLEIAEITDRLSKQPNGGKAILFENTPEGFPVLMNMMGSPRRIAMALGVDKVEDFTTKIDALFDKATSPKKSFYDKLKMLPLLTEASKWFPRRKKGRGASQQIVWQGEEIKLSRLPILFCAPHDGGRFITLPMVHTLDLETGCRNVGMYRMQIFSDNTTGLHWHKHKTGERHYQEYKKRGIKRMPVSIALGGDPAYTYSSTAPLPDNLDEYLLAGFIRGKAVELVKCLTNDIEVPADCDFVIEGYVDVDEEKVVEGAFGDHTGFYSLKDKYPLFHVTCITHRKDAVYPATIVGIPPQEDAYIAQATEKIFLSPIKAIIQPDINDMWLPMEGVAHNMAFLNINKSYIGQGTKVANSMWGAGQMMFNKFSVITSSLSGKLSNLEELKKVVNNISIPEDVIFSKGPLDVLDHTAPVLGYGGKMALDATEKLEGEYIRENVPMVYRAVTGCDEIEDIVALEDWSVIILKVARDVDFKVLAKCFIETNKVKGVKFILMFDKNVPIADYSTLMWLLGNNCDAVRDTAVVYNTLVFDARAKFGGINGFSREWPNVVTMNKETIELVDKRWKDYNIGDFIESPSKKHQQLVWNDAEKVD